MDAISAVGGGTGAPNAFSELGTEDFVRIIFTELGNQDPLAPSDSKALLEQLSSLRSIQSDMDLSRRLGALVAQNELAAASTLIGRSISGVSLDNARVEGTVASVTRTSAGAVLNLRDGARVLMSNLDQVFESAPAAGGGA
jgi:flagellar basal-body rod modification protein FlgD